MRHLLLLLPIALLPACETRDQTTAASAATGALIGAAIADDDDRIVGAALGGAAGIAASTLIGPSNNQRDCIYRDQRGQKFVAPC